MWIGASASELPPPRRIAEIVEEIDAEHARRVLLNGRAPLGVEAIRQQHPHGRPGRTKKSPAPSVHAASKAVRKQMIAAYRLFVEAYREASARLRAGDLAVKFHEGSARSASLDNTPREEYCSIMVRRKLQDELALTDGFPSLEEEVYIGLVRTAWQLNAKVHGAYGRGRLSPSQYNVLRILRGSRVALSCTQISDRMVTRDSDLTRLLSGLERRGLVKRQRAADDARRVENQITPAGRALLKRLDEPVADAIRSQLGGAGKKKLEDLAGLLEEIRHVAEEVG